MLDSGGCGLAVFADEGDGGLDFGDDAHVAEQLFGPAEIFSDWVEERNAATAVGIDPGFAMLNFGGIDEAAVDEVAASGFDVALIGEDAEARGRIAGSVGRRVDLVGLDEANARDEAGDAVRLSVAGFFSISVIGRRRGSRVASICWTSSVE